MGRRFHGADGDPSFSNAFLLAEHFSFLNSVFFTGKRTGQLLLYLDGGNLCFLQRQLLGEWTCGWDHTIAIYAQDSAGNGGKARSL